MASCEISERVSAFSVCSCAADASTAVVGVDEYLADGGVGPMLVLKEAHPYDAGEGAVDLGNDPVLGIVGEGELVQPQLVLDVALVLWGIDLGGEDGLFGKPGTEQGVDGLFIVAVVGANAGGFSQGCTGVS